jgi:Family of unknown function (DUF6535)
LIVAAFLVESYKKLSPDSGDRNGFYLLQISQQLSSFTNGAFVPPQAFSSPPPSTAIIWVNALWLLSFVLSVMSALSATLTQQWVSRYLQLPRIPGLPSEQARVRSFLFFGAHNYGMINAAETPATLLHISVFLFFSGQVIFFFTVYETVAIILSASLTPFAVVYVILTILPCIDHRCPYHTPMSSVCWYLWHASLLYVTLCIRGLLRLLHSCLVPYNLGDVTSSRQRILTQWLQTIGDSVKKHRQCMKYGFRRGIVQGALEAPETVDLKAITWLFKLPGLAEKRKIQEFVSHIPGVTIVQLMSAPVESGKVIFRDHLLSLLQSCAPGTVGLDEDTRRHRLLVCLDAIHHIAKASSVPHGDPPPESVLSDVRINFANIGLMRRLWTDSDPSIRLVSRSICALLARQLLRRHRLEQSELAWLQDVIGEPSNTIFNSLGNLPTVDYMNLDAYVYGVLSRQTGELPVKQAAFFSETVTMLTSTGSVRISALLRRADEQNNRLRQVVGQLRRIYPRPRPESQLSNNPNRHSIVYEKV